MQTTIQLTESELVHVIRRISEEMKSSTNGRYLGKRKIFEQTKTVTPQPKAQPTQTPGATPTQNVGAKTPTPQQLAAAKQKIASIAQKEATTIYTELKNAFDMDKDGDLKDWDGTNEGGALAAIRKIKSKETLNLLNQMIVRGKQFGSLKAWVNTEMSDFDSEYGDIWKKLESLGYSGQNKNILYKIAGYSPIGLAVKGADKAIDYLRSLTLEQIMEGFRGIVGGTLGTIAQVIISLTGPVGSGIVLAINGVLVAWDIYQLSTGSKNFKWFNLIADILGTTFAGFGLKAALQPARGALETAATLPQFFQKMAKNYPETYRSFQTIGNTIGKIGQTIVNVFRSGVAWMTKVMPFLKPMLAPIGSGLTKLGSIITDILNSIKGGAKNVVGKVSPTLTGASTRILNTKVSVALGGVLKNLQTKGLAYLQKHPLVGQKALEGTDQFALSQVQDFLKNNGSTATVKTAQYTVCKMGAKQCIAMKAIGQAAG